MSFSSPTVTPCISTTARVAMSMPGHVGCAVDRVMAYGERLAHAAKDDLLVRDVARRTHRMHRHAIDEGTASALEARKLGLLAGRVARAIACVGDEPRRADGSTRRGILLAVMMKLDDLDIGEILGRLLGKEHHEHGTGREVGCMEERGISRGGLVVYLLETAPRKGPSCQARS